MSGLFWFIFILFYYIFLLLNILYDFQLFFYFWIFQFNELIQNKFSSFGVITCILASKYE